VSRGGPKQTAEVGHFIMPKSTNWRGVWVYEKGLAGFVALAAFSHAPVPKTVLFETRESAHSEGRRFNILEDGRGPGISEHFTSCVAASSFPAAWREPEAFHNLLIRGRWPTSRDRFGFIYEQIAATT
jgi:hypothetical protein